MSFLLVFIGLGIGGMCRHGVGMMALKWFGPSFRPAVVHFWEWLVAEA